jgi:hypothetical protein
MVVLPHSPYEGTPQTGPNLERDQTVDDSWKATEIEREIARLQSAEKHDVKRIELARDFSQSGLNMVYFGSENPSDEVPIVFIPGLGAFMSLMEAAAIESAKLGRDAIIYTPPRKQEKHKAYHPRHYFNPMLFQQQGLVKVMQSVHENPEVTELHGGNSVDEFDVAGWSMGNRIGTGTASFLLRKPRNKGVTIRNAQSVAGAGNDGRGGLEQLVNHAGSVKNLIKRDVIEGVPLMMNSVRDKDTFTQDAKNHFIPAVGRFLRETAYIAIRPQVDSFVDDMHHADDGAHLYSANMYNGDSLFPPEKTLVHSRDMLDYYSVEPGEHTKLAAHPEECAIGIVAVSNVMARYGRLLNALQFNARALK